MVSIALSGPCAVRVLATIYLLYLYIWKVSYGRNLFELEGERYGNSVGDMVV
jgi:hypothetical protein